MIEIDPLVSVPFYFFLQILLNDKWAQEWLYAWMRVRCNYIQTDSRSGIWCLMLNYTPALTPSKLILTPTSTTLNLHLPMTSHNSLKSLVLVARLNISFLENPKTVKMKQLNYANKASDFIPQNVALARSQSPHKFCKFSGFDDDILS